MVLYFSLYNWKQRKDRLRDGRACSYLLVVAPTDGSRQELVVGIPEVYRGHLASDRSCGGGGVETGHVADDNLNETGKKVKNSFQVNI